ncbi:MAG: outer membrane beta-barrel protein [Candidatus Aminicenantes bacterium]|nr:outer membrane beta-barrel protein [Candidatus Aminicenantes bacterium]NIM83655.1 outer membrane beta-barrel protein [Candidatus Aminicenantes bacterium]NIN23079.1 outer membrane beta-barrel protein [Candidatus Aminicenantes bacterium]NIN46806.1 outer membrane beta-barrel protein [Candidatus Aminicenantes bacterium]NIN89728.1 outer membrane beta-barrel protein [Candidatus Aminicenantes bacterium]
MKRTLLFVLMLVVFLVVLGKGNGFAADRLMIVASANYFSPGDKDFKDFYGKGQFYPELKAGFKVSPKLYLWAGYGWFSAKETTPVLNLEAKAKQQFLSAGLGLLLKISSTFDYKVEAGLFFVSYKEEALGAEVSDSAIGLRLDNGVTFHMTRHLFVEFSIGFLTASDTIDDITVKLGGLKAGIGLGVLF